MKRSGRNTSRDNRRQFLSTAGACAALTNTSVMSTLLNLSATNTVVAQTGGINDYKAIVCVFLFGGNDSFNMLTPTSVGERANYLAARGGEYGVDDGGLGLPLAGLHSINSGSRNFGIHPSMPEMKTLYDAGKLTFLCNVGSLVQPTTKAQYEAESNLPLGLFSHADLEQHWMSSVPQSRSNVTGWAGRMADLVGPGANSNEKVSMNIAMDSVNLLQTGNKTVPYVVGTGGAEEVDWYGHDSWTPGKIFTNLTDDVFTRSYSNLIERTFAKSSASAFNAAIEFNQTTSAITSVDPFFPSGGSYLQEQLKMVAKAIGANQTLNQNRQIFFVRHNGWDNHDELIGNQAYNLMEVSQALKSFQDAIDELDLTNNVVTFTASEFARTLTSNGAGTDHAWGGNQIVMGGPVQGNQIYGEYPFSLAPDNPLDLGRGRLLPTTSVDEMAAEIAMWYGVPNDNNLEMILPNVRNFFSSGSSYPIGFLS